MEDAAAAMTERRRALGSKIAEARKACGWKQKQLASAVHVEPMTVSRWERGQHAPDIDMLEQIAAATNRPLAFFIDADQPTDEAGAAPQLARIEAQLEEVLARLKEIEGERSRAVPPRHAASRR